MLACAGFWTLALLIRGVEIEAGDESVQLYQEGVFPALRESGRRVTLGLLHVKDRPDLAARGRGIGNSAQRVRVRDGRSGPGFHGRSSPGLLEQWTDQLRCRVPGF